MCPRLEGSQRERQRERRMRNPDIQNILSSYSPAPDDSGLHGCRQAVGASKHLTPMGRPGLAVFITPLSTVGLPKGPPAVCICQLWVDSQPAGDCTTSGPCHLTAALPGNSWLTSHGSVAELLLKTSLCPPFCRGISSRTRHGAVGPRYTLVKKKKKTQGRKHL